MAPPHDFLPFCCCNSCKETRAKPPETPHKPAPATKPDFLELSSTRKLRDRAPINYSPVKIKNLLQTPANKSQKSSGKKSSKKQTPNTNTPSTDFNFADPLPSSANSSRPATPTPTKMSSQTGKWREDQVLIVCPGSLTTMAQLGCSELSPPMHRIPTRMFKDKEAGGWRPYHTYKRKKATSSNAAALTTDGKQAEKEDEWEIVEDTDSVEGAVYPMQGGRIVHLEAFLAFLDHVHTTLTTTYHNTPIVLMSSPQWTRYDTEAITRYIFEKTRTPALCMMHSGLATQYGLKWGNMTVVDIGYEKVDVTCIYEGRVVNHRELGFPIPIRFISGGEVFTQKLHELLKDKDFTYDMAEQLKKSSICEVLPYTPGHPDERELPTASAASQPATSSGSGQAPEVPPKINEPYKPAAEMENETTEAQSTDIGDGVLDVASIVTSGNTRDFLAKKEKEKAEKGKGRKGKAQEAEAAKPTRLPNSKRTHNVFHYEQVIQEEVPIPGPVDVASIMSGNKTDGATKEEGQAVGNQQKTEGVEDPASVPGAATEGENNAGDAEKGTAAGQPGTAGEQGAELKTPADQASDVKMKTPEQEASAAATATGGGAAAPASAPPSYGTQIQNKRVRRDIEVGLERFTFAHRGEIDRIVTTIYRTIQSIDEMYMRPACWDSIVFVGNGSRLRGLRDNIMQTLKARHLISPSTATMFTSELPSNIATPTGTGSQTPTGSFTGAPHQLPTAAGGSSGVNPLLQAATTASSLGLGQGPSTPAAPGSTAGDLGQTHSTHFHSQTPTSIKLAPLPTYLSEWTKNGYEEAMFLGAQIAGRLAFCVHNLDLAGQEAQRLMSLSRVDFNEMGPKGVRTHSLLQ